MGFMRDSDIVLSSIFSASPGQPAVAAWTIRNPAPGLRHVVRIRLATA
jgi:hypothetical protein